MKKYFEKSDVAAKWEASGWAKKRAAVAKRRTLNDFERYERRNLIKTNLIILLASP